MKKSRQLLRSGVLGTWLVGAAIIAWAPQSLDLTAEVIKRLDAPKPAATPK